MTDILKAPGLTEETKRENLSAVLIVIFVGSRLNDRFPESIFIDGTMKQFGELIAKIYEFTI